MRLLGGPSSIRFRLTLWNVGVLALILGALGFILRYTAQAQLMCATDAELTDRADQELTRWQHIPHGPPPPGMFPNPMDGPMPDFGEPPRERPRPLRHAPDAPFRTFDTQGQSLHGDDQRPWHSRLLALSASGETGRLTEEINGEPMRVLSMPLTSHGKVRGVVQAAASLTETERALDGLTTTLLTMIPLALLACGASGLFLTSRAIRPVKEISEAADRIGEANLSERLPIRGGDEFAHLGATINSMLTRLEGAFARQEEAIRQQRRFTADASHELRTPLTTIKGNVSLVLSGDRTAEEYRRALETTNRAADIMNGIIQDLLLLARTDSGELRIEHHAISVREMFLEVAELLRTGEHAPIRIKAVDPALALCGDRSYLVRVLMNLVENGLRHTPIDGAVSLSARLDDRGRRTDRLYGSVGVRERGSSRNPEPSHTPTLRLPPLDMCSSSYPTRERASPRSTYRTSRSGSTAWTPRAPVSRAVPGLGWPSAGA